MINVKKETVKNDKARQLLLGIYSENHNSKRCMYTSVDCSTIYNHQDMEATLIFTDR